MCGGNIQVINLTSHNKNFLSLVEGGVAGYAIYQYFKEGLWPKNRLRCLSLILIQYRNPTFPSKKICQIQLVNRLFKPNSVNNFRKLGSQNLIFAIFFQIARGLRLTISPQSTTSIRFFISVIQRLLFRRVKELSLCHKL